MLFRSERLKHVEDIVGDSISEQDCRRLLQSLQERGLITVRERLLIEVALRHGALSRRVTDAAGVESSYELGVQGGVARVVREQGPGCSACGGETGSSYEYTGRQQVSRVTDAKGVVTSSSYDERGNRVRETRAFGTGLARTTSYTYTAENQLATKREASGSNPGQQVETAYSYNAERSEERRVGKECRSRWSPYH